MGKWFLYAVELEVSDKKDFFRIGIFNHLHLPRDFLALKTDICSQELLSPFQFIF